MEQLNTLTELGFSLPSPANLFAMLIFSLIGFAAYRYGSKAESIKAKLLGIALMMYSYFVSETWQLYAVGLLLCVALFIWRD